jgi:Nitrile hydratase, alpha chain/Nitrile hydratase beta subunit
VRVHDSTAMVRYLVLPLRPEGTDHYSAERLEALVTRDTMIGGQSTDGIQRVDHVLEPWEKRCGVEALGAEVIGKLTYYERWIVTFANILFRKGILTPTELALKMQQIEAERRHG